jgi:hypothetical protein
MTAFDPPTTRSRCQEFQGFEEFSKPFEKGGQPRPVAPEDVTTRLCSPEWGSFCCLTKFSLEAKIVRRSE